MNYVKIRRQNSVYYRLRRRAVASHSQWGVRNPNGLSSYIANEYSLPAEVRKGILLPCHKTVAQSWAALRKCWQGFNISKSQNNISGMQKYAYRIRKIQAQMGIRPKDFDPHVLDENTVLLIDAEYRLQSRQNQELDNTKESRMETTELNYEEIMTKPNATVKLPAPRENIFTSHYPRSDKSCPSRVDRSQLNIEKKPPYHNQSCPVGPVVKMEKKPPYYNQSCPVGPTKQKYPDDVRNDTHIVYFDRQCHSRSVKQDQNNFAVPDPNQPPVYQALEGKPSTKPGRHTKDPIHTIHENTACPYDSSEDQLQKSRKSQDQNNFAVPDPNQPPVYQALEGNPRDSIHILHEKQTGKKKQKSIQRRSRFCPYESQI